MHFEITINKKGTQIGKGITTSRIVITIAIIAMNCVNFDNQRTQQKNMYGEGFHLISCEKLKTVAAFDENFELNGVQVLHSSASSRTLK